MQNLQANNLIIYSDSENQRIDNFLIKKLKNLPRSKIYKIIRSGEVRVNSKRIKPSYKLMIKDKVRVPPLKLTTQPTLSGLNHKLNLEKITICENENVLIINKPPGIPVHSGSGNPYGVIEILRSQNYKYLELMHRIDKDTSGILMLAKNRKTLVSIQQKWLQKKVTKRYLLLVHGNPQSSKFTIKEPIIACKQDGERIMRVNSQGKPSVTKFKLLRSYKNYSLLFAWPITGRTHQIRVHAKYAGFPIVGDKKYKKYAKKELVADGVNNFPGLFLHASAVSIDDFEETFKAREIICPMTTKQLEIIKTLSYANA